MNIPDLIARLLAVAESSRRADGSQIPLGELITQAADALEALIAREAVLVEALERIKTLDYKRAAVNCCAYTAVQIALTALTDGGKGRG